MKISYKFSLDVYLHQDIIEFLEGLPKKEREKHIIMALGSYVRKFSPEERTKIKREYLQLD